jgi:hypothetical protein
MNFRFWCKEKWFEHMAELELYKQPLPYTANMYKFWLKREFKFQQANENEKSNC